MKKLRLSNEVVEQSGVILATLDFWFKDNGHIRCPFPEYMQDDLKQATVDRFTNWVKEVKKEDKAEQEEKVEMTDEIIAEELEKMMFEEALKFTSDEEEKLTILYPFMPRLGDQVNDSSTGDIRTGKIASRQMDVDGDDKYLTVQVEAVDGVGKWESRFELPA